MRAVLAAIALWLTSSGVALALPEFARSGYFACSACHASPGGGGVLTPYGHGIAAERLSTFGGPGTLKPVPDWLLLGSDARSAMVDVQSPAGEVFRRIRMEDDAAVGIQVPHLTAVVQGGILGQSKDAPEAAGRPALRQAWAMGELGPATLRAGRFMPRYGLNFPQHATNVRRELGFDEGGENHVVELGALTESDEVSAAWLAGVTRSAAEPTGAPERGAAASWYHYLFGKHRVGASVLYGSTPEAGRLAYGLSGVFALPGTAFLLAEGDCQVVTTATQQTYQGMAYLRLAFEPWQGVIPFLSGESTALDLTEQRRRSEVYLAGLQWYPVARMDFEGAVGPALDLATYTYVTQAYLTAHFYL